MRGAWTARWADWVIGLQSNETGWDAAVWRWLLDSKAPRQEVEAKKGFATHEEAVKWACDVMRKDGATVMVLGASSITLESMLRFAPAPMAVT